MWGELNDFAGVWLQPRPGEGAAVLAALDAALGGMPEPSGDIAAAAELLKAALEDEERRPVSIVYAPVHYGAQHAREVTAILANIAITLAGENAAEAFVVLPQEANVWGMRDTGGSPDLLPSYRLAADESARREMERLWGVPLPSSPGLTFEEMLAPSTRPQEASRPAHPEVSKDRAEHTASPSSKLKALVVMNDNPLMLAPNGIRVRIALESLDFLAVIDSLPTDTAKLADVVLADVSPWGKEGTTTSADRRVLRLDPATAPQGEAQQGWRILSELGARLAERLNPGEIRIRYQSAAEIMDEMSQVIPLYANATYREMDSGAQQPIDGLGPRKAERQAVSLSEAPQDGGGFRLIAGRSLYMSYEGAAIHSPNADKLHREEHVVLNPADAAALGLAEGDAVIIRNNGRELRTKTHLTNAVAPKTAHIPLYLDGGAPGELFDADSPVATVDISRA
jgi:predicted molibdopterin-dependent oxidoreductase YjgC